MDRRRPITKNGAWLSINLSRSGDKVIARRRAIDHEDHSDQANGSRNSSRPPENIDMKQTTQVAAAQANPSEDKDGRQTGRLFALSMAVLFSLIFVLHAISG
jgi:hypothetical protein